MQHTGLLALTLILLGSSALAAESLDTEAATAAAANYQQYCALCHGEDRQGHVNDHAPSLRSKSLLESGSPWVIWEATGYGRPGTPMAPFLDEVGGPLTSDEILDLSKWLRQEAGVDKVDMEGDLVPGDAARGAVIYAAECFNCHGAEGEGGIGTALGNSAMLALTPDGFLRHAIIHGRQGTEMPAFGDRLSAADIDHVTAFLRSRGTGWTLTKPVYREPPAKENYVTNPGGGKPRFELMDSRYVSSADLYAALDAGNEMVLLDTRALPLWQMANIEGSVPMPYYYDSDDFDSLASDLPRDGTMIVTYCECPRAAADYVNKKLVERGFENLAVLFEGIQGWISLGYPVVLGKTTTVEIQPFEVRQEGRR
jgi:mono/diheme cytochrome c family protein/rhodanese-related sulfurtransferase